MTNRVPVFTDAEALQLWQHFDAETARYKEQAWSQVTWSAALSAALLGFSVSTQLEPGKNPFLLVLLQSAVLFASMVLWHLAMIVTRECGDHLIATWTMSTRIVKQHRALKRLVALESKQPPERHKRPRTWGEKLSVRFKRRARLLQRRLPLPFSDKQPSVIRRIRRPLWLLLLAHVAWFIVAQSIR